MKKNTYIRFIVAIATVFMILGGTAQGVSATIISENTANDTLVSETPEEIDAHSHNKRLIEEQREDLTANGYQFINVDLPNNGTWGYDQTFARNELFPKLNEARMNKENWWLCDNNTNPIALDTPPTKAYVYDTELEKAAMQRAADLLFSYIHARPNKMNFAEVYEQLNNPYQWAYNYNEMISFAPMYTTDAYDKLVLIEPTAEGIVYGFMESYENMPGAQLHRKCILTDKYYRIGIGVVKLADGHRFVAVEVSEDKTADGEYIPVYSGTDPVDGYKETTVQIAYKPNDTNRCLHSVINVLSPIKENELGGYIKLIPGETFDLSQEWFSRNQKSSSSFGLCTGTDPLFFNPSNGQWKSDNTNIADVTDNKIIAKNPGTTDINFTDITDGHVVGSVKVTVPEPVLQSAAATYDNGSTLVGTTIYGDDVTLTNHFDYGEDEYVTLSDYGVYSFTVSKEGTNTFTFNHPDAPAGTTIPVTLTVQGIKETPAPKPPKKEESTVKPAAPSTNTGNSVNTGNTGTLHAQKITVAKKFRKTFTISRRKLKKSGRVYKISAKVTPLDGGVGHGLVSYKVTKYPKGAKKYVTVNKKGKITIKRNAKKGTYKIKITANSVSNRLKKASKTITIKVK